MPDRRKDIFYIVLLALLVLMSNWRLMFAGQTYQTLGGFHHDFEAIHFLVMRYLNEFYLRDYFPLWFPYYSFGHPGLGAYLPALFLPNSVPFFSLMPYPSSLAAFCVFNYMLIAFFSYMFFRELGMSGLASFFAAAWNTLSGFTIWLSHYHHTLGFLPWFYLFMWSATAIIKRKDLLPWLGATAAAGLMLLSGEAEVLTYTLYLGGIWLVVYMVWSRVTTQVWIRVLVLIAAAVFIGALLSSIQAWPALNYLTRTVRVQGLTPSSYAATFITLEQVISPIPLLLSRALDNIFIGVTSLFFALIGIFFVRGKASRAASIIVMLIVLFVALGSPMGLSKLFYNIPLFSIFIRHFKLALIMQFGFIIVCGMGLDYMLSRIPKLSRLLLIFFLIFGVIDAATLPGTAWKVLYLLILLGSIIGALRSRAVFSVFIIALTFADVCSYLWRTPFALEKPNYWPVYERLVNKMDGNARAHVMYPALSMYRFVRPYQIPVQVGGWDMAHSFDTWLSFPLESSALFFEAIEPWAISRQGQGYMNFNFNTFFKSLDFIRSGNRHLINLANLRYIFCEDMALKEAELRPILADPVYFLNPFKPSGFAPYTLELIEEKGVEMPAIFTDKDGEFVYDSRFDPGSMLRFSMIVEGGENSQVEFKVLWRDDSRDSPETLFQSELKTGASTAASKSDRIINIPLPVTEECSASLIFRLDVSGAVRKAGWINPVIVNSSKTLRLIAQNGRAMAFENTEALDRARIVHDVVTAEDMIELRNIIADRNSYNPATDVLLTDDVLESSEYRKNTSAEKETAGNEYASILDYHPEHVTIEARLSSPGWLVLSDTYYPGWRSYVDGKEKRMYQADLTFRGIPLDEGKHDILFLYAPLDFRLGLWSTIASLLSLACIICLRRTRHFKRSSF